MPVVVPTSRDMDTEIPSRSLTDAEISVNLVDAPTRVVPGDRD